GSSTPDVALYSRSGEKSCEKAASAEFALCWTAGPQAGSNRMYGAIGGRRREGGSGRWLSRNKTKNSGACHLSGRTLVKRREFFKSATALTAGAAATAALATPAIAQGNITWRMVTTWPKNFPGLGVGAQRLADRITAASGGRLTVQVYAAGELVPPLQALDAV